MKNYKLLIHSMAFVGFIYLLRSSIRLGLMFIASWAFTMICIEIMSRKKVNKRFYIPVILSFWFNIIGELYFYYNLGIYDKLLHLTVPILVTAIFYDIYKGKNYKKILLSTFLLLIAFEIFEIALYGFFDFTTLGVIVNGEFTMSPTKDTLLDILFGVIGSGFYLLIKK